MKSQFEGGMMGLDRKVLRGNNERWVLTLHVKRITPESIISHIVARPMKLKNARKVNRMFHVGKTHETRRECQVECNAWNVEEDDE